MATTSSRKSLYNQSPGMNEQGAQKNGDTVKKDLWSSMLDSVASGKRLPEKNLLVLGGSPDSQKEFLEALSAETIAKRGQDRYGSKQPPVANNFALGYTYYDVPDADHEDFLARVSVYLLGDPSPSFTPLLRPLLTPETIPNTLLVVLLNWSQPWLWLRQLRDWIRLLRTLLTSLDPESKHTMEEVMVSWRDRGRGSMALDGTGTSAAGENGIALPLGPGEWDEALGLPLCVVCQNADQIEKLEREHGWKEEEFDFILQSLRIVLLKHGASLVYTMPTAQSPLHTLVNSSLGIHSLLRKQPLKLNVIDRDKVVLPPNWDSWGKLRLLQESFDVEGFNQGWSLDIQEGPATPATGEGQGEGSTSQQPSKPAAGAVAVYEDTIQDPGAALLSTLNEARSTQTLDVTCLDPQEFLAGQLAILNNLRSTAPPPKPDIFASLGLSTTSTVDKTATDTNTGESRVSEHIGPVQFNMGGIQVDAEDMLQKLKERQNDKTPSPDTSTTGNEALSAFFARLINRDGESSTESHTT